MATSPVDEIGRTQLQHACDRCGAQVGGRETEKRQSGWIGADDPAVIGESNDALSDGTDTFGERMKTQAQDLAVTRVEQAVFDHLRRGAHQAKGMRMAAALVAGDVEHAEQSAVRRAHRGGGAGEEAVAVEVVLGAMHDHRTALGERRADGVGAAMAFMPGSTRHQRNAFGTIDEVGIAQRLQQHAAIVGEDHHAAGVARLGVQVFHHRPGMSDQFALTLGRAQYSATVKQRCIGQAANRNQAGFSASTPGSRDNGRHQLGRRRLVAFDQQMTRLTQGRARRHGQHLNSSGYRLVRAGRPLLCLSRYACAPACARVPREMPGGLCQIVTACRNDTSRPSARRSASSCMSHLKSIC